MSDTIDRAIAIVGIGAILPDAPDATAFWANLTAGRYSISDVPADRWDPARYHDPDPHAADKTYSKIGGWVRSFAWDPARWKLPVPPRVGDAMDAGQKWAVTCTREALIDAGYPDRPLDRARTAVILGNAMAGEKHYLTALRVFFPEFAHALATAPSFAALEPQLREAIAAESRALLGDALPAITEDTMPGELSNCIAGRVANLFDFHGPNYVVDAACASAVAALSAAIDGLVAGDYDAVVTGGIDRNMGPSAFVKFCKIGALSATGTRPYADGADGFVMGEGAVVFLLQRLADAERAGRRIYAVVRGVGGSSDGKGKGITAPNPIGQRLAVERAWQDARLSPATASLIEGHGTSTRVGDVVEVEALGEVLRASGAAPRSIPLGSVKSNIGHLKAAAGAAGLLKAALALHHKVLPPSLGFARPNPNIDFERSPLVVHTALQPWAEPACGVRRAGVSAFGFGGTNFHAVLEEHVAGALTRGRVSVGSTGVGGAAGGGGGEAGAAASSAAASAVRPPLRGALVLGAPSLAALADRLAAVHRDAAAGQAPPPAPPAPADLAAAERLAIDYGDAAELADRASKALKAVRGGDPAAWRMLRQQGVFLGHGPRGKLAFLYTGQGSQYIGMLAALRASEPIVAATFAEADRVMAPLLGGRALSSYIFADTADPAARARAEDDLRQTAITQPALLATDLALTRLLDAHGVRPDLVIGHSLGEYGALVAAGALPFAHALEAVSARGREMTHVAVADPGWMVAVTAPLPEIEAVVAATEGYVVVANLNSRKQAVIGGESAAVERAMQALVARGYPCVRLPVSHAFHTRIVAPASEPLRRVLERLDIRPPRLPVVSNATGGLYPGGDGAREAIIDLLARQVASPVQFVRGLETLYAEGARTFVEVGPKRALAGLADDTLGDRPGVMVLSTNHPKLGDAIAFNQALCGLYAAGFGAAASASLAPPLPVVITGAALGLPGTPRVFDDANLARVLRGDSLIDVVPARHRRAMVDRHVTRVVKGEDGSGAFQRIDDPDDVIRLAGRGGALDLEAEFGISAERIAALDVTTQLAIGAGLDALRDAGIPLVHHYKTTSKGTKLPDRWGLPEALRDDTGVIFASAFPGYDAFAADLERYHRDVARRDQLALIERVLAELPPGDSPLRAELAYRRDELAAEQAQGGYEFDRRFLFRVLAMGHSQLAELIGARGPNTQVNAACASTTQAVALAEDWIRAGRCRRVIVVAGDDVTSDHLLAWIGAGFLSSGAAATDDVVERAALPFDRRRHGMIMGMGAAAIVVEHPDAARERGLAPIAEVLGTAVANSAFHGTRLDIHHITQVMERVVRAAEATAGVARQAIAPELMFMSHETYTPARGGSASAEIHALREVFGDAADRIVIANTKGLTGHPMAVGIEDVVAIKALETGVVPPIPNHREVDPELGALNLSHGGPYPIRYALRLAAGFGSQISMSLLRWTAPPDGAHRPVAALGHDYRVRDRAAWNAWLGRLAGGGAPELEVVKRTLRIKDRGPAADAAARPAPAIAGHAASEPAADARVAPAPIVPAVPPVVPASAPPVSVPPSSAASSPASIDPVKQKVLSIVASTTGYPVDMLDETLDLEADLGVDTVKQAETFAAVRAAYDIPRQENLKLRDFPTLAHVVQFVYAHRPDLAQPAGAAAVAEASSAAAVTAAHAGTASPAPTTTAPATAVPVTTAPAAAAAIPATAGDDPVRARVLAIIAEKTGYPTDMLDDGLDLEADLGVDTVKQAETFAAVRAAYDIPRQENLKLRDFPTIAHVVAFVHAHRPDLAKPAGAAVAVEASSIPAGTSACEPVRAQVLAIIAEKTGYPIDMLDDGLDLEADLGVDTVKQAETFAAVRAAYDIPRQEDLKLRDFPTIAHVVAFVYAHRPDLAPAAAPASVIAAPVSADTLVTADRAVPAAAALAASSAAPDTASIAPASAAFPRRVPTPVLRPPLELCKPTGVVLAAGARVVVMRDRGGVADALLERLAVRGVGALVIDGSWLPGDILQRLAEPAAFTGVYWLAALDDEGDPARLSHAEFRDALAVRVKRLAVVARALYGRLAEPGAFVVAATRMGGAHGYGELPASAPLGGAVTGFVKALAREREAALCKAVDFATDAPPGAVADALIAETLGDPGAVEIGALHGRRIAIGLVEAPPAEASEALAAGQVVVTGAAGSIVAAITADLAARARGGTFHLLDLAPAPDPADPDLQRFATDREGLRRELFERGKARGERVTPAMIERALAGLERQAAALAAIDAVTRAGGMARYHQVDLCDPAAVAAALAEVRAAGRLDLLIHAAGLEISRALPDKPYAEFERVFDVKADGWCNLIAGLGAASLGAVVVFGSIAGRFGNAGQTDYSAANDLLCKLVSHLRRTRPEVRGVAIDWTAWAGIGMASRGSIPKVMAAAGIAMLPASVGVPAVAGELAAGGGEVVIAGELGGLLRERDAEGGLDPARAAAVPHGPMIGRLVGMGVHAPLVAEVTLDPAHAPFLDDHRIDGTAVLPGVMGIEGFAELAQLVVPGARVAAVEHVRFDAPVKFYRDEPRTLRLEAWLVPAGGEVIAECQLIGVRRLAGRDEPQRTVHFTGRVRLAPAGDHAPAPAIAHAAPPDGSPLVERAEIYRTYFHGPAYQVLDTVWTADGDALGRMAEHLPPDADRAMLLDPRRIELCFQTAGIWELRAHGGRLALPREVEELRWNGGAADGPVVAHVHARDDGRFDAEVDDARGVPCLIVRGYRTAAVEPGA